MLGGCGRINVTMPADNFAIDGHKLHLHPERVAQWLKDPFSTFPIYVEISPVGHCNHRCSFCAVDYIGYKNRSIDLAALKDALFSMAKNGVKSIMLAGEGEPLLHPDIIEIINYAKSVGLDIAITTNGVAMTDKFIDNAAFNVSWIKVSLNAGSKEDYVKIHKAKEKDWDKVWDNLKRLRSKNYPNLVIGTQAVVLPDNIGSIYQLAQNSKAIGLAYTVLKPYSQHKKSITREYEDIKYASQETSLANVEVLSDDNFNVVVRRSAMASWDSSKRSYHKCYSTPTFWAYIMATGDVYGCSAYLLDDRFLYGNITSESFAAIWLGSRRRQSLSFVSEGLDISECRKNCRMNKVNEYLWEVKNPQAHSSFI